MCLSELGRRCNCLFQTTLWLQKKRELLWYGVVFHCSDKANYVTSLFFYFIFTPVSSLWRVSNLFFAISWLCSLWVNFNFLSCFLPKQGIRSSTSLLAIPWLCMGIGPIPLQKPPPDQHISEADSPWQTHVPPALFPSAKHFIPGNVLRHSEDFSRSYFPSGSCQVDLQVEILQGAPKPPEYLGTAHLSLGQGMP